MLWDLQDLGAKEIAGWLGRALDDGAPKIFVVHECLKLRRKHPEWFGRDAGYTAVQAKGEKARHVLAFLRGDRVLTVVPRLPLTLAAAWDGTTVEVPAGHWRNRFTGNIVEGGTVEVEALLGDAYGYGVGPDAEEGSGEGGRQGVPDAGSECERILDGEGRRGRSGDGLWILAG
jgi:(1->4)-alpha-D-glucan 1-alpha-D-glucosylmutase